MDNEPLYVNFDVKMMVGEDNGYAIVNIESFSS